MKSQLIRCPVCLVSQSVKADLTADTQLYCGNCKRGFFAKNALPLNEGRAINFANHGTSASTLASSLTPVTTMEPVIVRNAAVTWITAVLMWLLTLSKARPYMATLKGPDYLWFYFLMFCAIWAALFTLRKFWEDSTQITVLAILFFESIGAIRLFDASAAGMHKFGFMIMMMVVGGLAYFVRANQMNNSSWSNDCSSWGSSCSGCGGSCGGGGCGGCGG